MTEQIRERLRALIAERGSIGFDEYMELVLYGPEGFFDRPPIGPDRHFVTAPHVHPFVFAHCVRGALLDGWRALGEPDPLELVELGAGDGTLAAALLEAFAELPWPEVRYTAVEVSPGAREALRARGLHVVERVDALEPFEGLVVANELLDNLPFVPARGRADGPVEIRVGWDEGSGRLAEVEVPWTRPVPPPPALAEGEVSAVPVGAFALLETVATRLRRGVALLIDYGSPEGPAGAVHGYRDHRSVADVLADPGASDVTAGVDWRMVAENARAVGFLVHGPVDQASALRALGHPRWEATMREQQSRLGREGRGSQAVAVWESRSRASLLADPSGLGAFGWLVLSTPGLGEPPWLARAAGRSTD